VTGELDPWRLNLHTKNEVGRKWDVGSGTRPTQKQLKKKKKKKFISCVKKVAIMLKYIVLEYWRGDDISLGWLVVECM
jgi:hypothetical protein